MLLQHFPNTFGDATTIRFDIAVPTNIRIGVFDVLGRQVRSLANGVMTSGRHEVKWDGTAGDGMPAAGGVYFYRLQASAYSDTRMMILSR